MLESPPEPEPNHWPAKTDFLLILIGLLIVLLALQPTDLLPLLQEKIEAVATPSPRDEPFVDNESWCNILLPAFFSMVVENDHLRNALKSSEEERRKQALVIEGLTAQLTEAQTKIGQLEADRKKQEVENLRLATEVKALAFQLTEAQTKITELEVALKAAKAEAEKKGDNPEAAHMDFADREGSFLFELGKAQITPHFARELRKVFAENGTGEDGSPAGILSTLHRFKGRIARIEIVGNTDGIPYVRATRAKRGLDTFLPRLMAGELPLWWAAGLRDPGAGWNGLTFRGEALRSGRSIFSPEGRPHWHDEIDLGSNADLGLIRAMVVGYLLNTWLAQSPETLLTTFTKTPEPVKQWLQAMGPAPNQSGLAVRISPLSAAQTLPDDTDAPCWSLPVERYFVSSTDTGGRGHPSRRRIVIRFVGKK
jgi:hypothetical protein